MVLRERFRDGLCSAGQRSLGLAAGAGLGDLPHQVGQAGVLAWPRLQVEAVARLGEPEIGVDAGHHDPNVDLENLDAYERHAHERVDHYSSVEYEFQDVVQTAASA
jgi:hypothetical protein